MAAGAEKMLNLMEVGGSLLERVAVGNPLSLVLAASAFALSLGYLFQLSYRRHLGSEQKVGAAGGGPGRGPGRAGGRGLGEPGGVTAGPGPGRASGQPSERGGSGAGAPEGGRHLCSSPGRSLGQGWPPSPQRALRSRGRGAPGPRRSRGCEGRGPVTYEHSADLKGLLRGCLTNPPALCGV